MGIQIPSRSPSNVPGFQYNGSLSQTGANLSTVASVLYGFYGENNSSTDAVYLQFFNLPVASVTIGTTVADFTIRLPAGGAVGRDAQDYPLMHFPVACSVFCTSTRTGASAPASNATVLSWCENRR